MSGAFTQEQEQAQRGAVLKVAYTWLGTPFRDQADSKGAGVDCAMFLVRVFVDSGILPPFDPRPYPPRWFMNQSEERYLNWISKFAQEIPEEEVQPGDVVIYQHGRCYSHSALIVSSELLIHAWFKDAKCTLTERRAPELEYLCEGKSVLPRPRKYFSIWLGPRNQGGQL